MTIFARALRFRARDFSNFLVWASSRPMMPLIRVVYPDAAELARFIGAATARRTGWSESARATRGV
jgi:hypothetical protein